MSRILRIVLVLVSLTMVAMQQTGTASAQANCAAAVSTTHTPSADTQSLWVLGTGSWRVANFWTNWPESNQADRKLILAPDQYVELLGGGTVYSWPANCERQARDGYDRNPLTGVTANQLGDQEWLCCDEVVFAQWEAYWAETAPAAAAQSEGCSPARRFIVSNPTNVEIAGIPAIIHPWWNNGKPPWGQTQTKVIMRPENRTVFVQMMGEYWMYENSEACNARLESELANAPGLPTKSFDEYRAAGLIR